MKIRLIRIFDKSLVAPLVLLAAWLRRLAVAIFAAVLGRAGESSRDSSGTEHWVAIKLVGMGDAVLMLPSLTSLRRREGDTLAVITTRRCRQVFAALGVADQVIVLDGGWKQVRAAWTALRRCTRLLDFEQHVYWSAALALMAPLQARRFGFRTRSRVRHLAFDAVVDPGREPRHMKEIFDDLARAAGRSPQSELLPLPIQPETAAGVDAWIASQGWRPGSYLVVAPGSGATVGFRRLSAEAWAEALRGVPIATPIVLVGTALEAALMEAIARSCDRPITVRLNLSIAELARLFGQAWKAVATDSGPMHLAAAMGVPVVGIFGPDTPRRYAPYNVRSSSVSLNLPCSPCNNCWVYREARCTNPERYACIRGLSPSLVLAAILQPQPGRADSTAARAGQ